MLHWTLSTKEQFETVLIPAIERMIEKEKAHIKSLENKKKEIEGFPWYKRPFYNTDTIEMYIWDNQVHLNRLESRLYDYVEYSKTLKS